MAATPQLRVSQATVSVAFEGSPNVHVAQAKVMVLYNLPAEELRASQAVVGALYDASLNVRAAQAKVLVLYSGRVDTPKLKTMGFNLDAHTFYVIRLGSSRKTLVYDKYTDTWSWWARQGLNSLDSHTGLNWRSAGNIANNFGSNIIVGDASSGSLYVMDPYAGTDSTVNGEETFQRVATGQMIARGRAVIPVYSVFLTASLGAPALGANTVTLEYSDDQGHTYVIASEPLTIALEDYAQDISWLSLGQVSAPGRLFRITDDGAFARIDGLTVNE